MSIRVVLVDDHALLREGLRTYLSRVQDVVVVGDAATARGAYELIEATSPDLVVLDIGLPGIDGIAAAREIQRRTPMVRLLALSGFGDADRVRWALGAGVRGYVLKDDDPTKVVDAIRAVARGERYFSDRLAVEPTEALGAADGVDPLDRLSARELEIFRMIVRGSSNTTISRTLCISVKTVETHRSHINKKLGARCPADLVRLAARRGLVDG